MRKVEIREPLHKFNSSYRSLELTKAEHSAGMGHCGPTIERLKNRSLDVDKYTISARTESISKLHPLKQ